jgi:hypothetical protein
MLRAQRLGQARTRFRLAKRIRWSVREAERYSSSHVPADEQTAGEAVRANRDALLALADRLEARPPHRLRGLAMVSHLVHDASSALYSGAGAHPLGVAVEAAQAALDEENQGAAPGSRDGPRADS